MRFPVPSRRLRVVVFVGLLLVAVLYLIGHSRSVGMRLNAAALAVATARGISLEVSQPASLEWPGDIVLHGAVVRRGSLTLTAARVAVRPAWLALVRGKIRVGRLALTQAALDIAIADTKDAGNTKPFSVRRFDSDLTIVARDLTVWVHGALPAQSWHVTSARVQLTQANGQSKLEAAANLPQGSELSVVATLGQAVQAQLTLEDVQLDDIAPELRGRIGESLAGAWHGTVDLETSSDLAFGRLGLHVGSRELVLSGASIADMPVGPLVVDAGLVARWDRRERRLYLEEASLALGPQGEISIAASGDANLQPEGLLRLRASLNVPDMERFIASLPGAIRPPVEAPRARGPLRGQLSIEGPWRDPLEWQVEDALDLAGMRAVARDEAAAMLTRTFSYHAVDAKGAEHEFLVGPERGDFVALSELPKYVADAVTTSEDGGFYGHQGFDFNEIMRSFVAVAQAGRAVRGGSTLTQQLAKNLYLSREKTYARKVREALVTLALESSLSKSRLLEIYLNIIEWGPNVYGIGSAAHTYFNKDARSLTPREAAYLASIIPNPVRYFAQRERGELSVEWTARLDTILSRMSETGRLDPEAYAQALRDPLVFSPN